MRVLLWLLCTVLVVVSAEAAASLLAFVLFALFVVVVITVILRLAAGPIPEGDEPEPLRPYIPPLR
jgi:hypothetical protein